MFVIILAFERVYFNSILWPSRPRNVCQRRTTLARSSLKKFAGSTRSQTCTNLFSSSSHENWRPRRQSSNFGRTDISRNGSGREFKGSMPPRNELSTYTQYIFPRKGRPYFHLWAQYKLNSSQQLQYFRFLACFFLDFLLYLTFSIFFC